MAAGTRDNADWQGRAMEEKKHSDVDLNKEWWDLTNGVTRETMQPKSQLIQDGWIQVDDDWQGSDMVENRQNDREEETSDAQWHVDENSDKDE